MPFQKETTLAAKWSSRQKDVLYHYPGSKADGRLLHSFFEYARLDPSNPDSKSFYQELEARGYDLTTFKFSIKKKAKTEASENGP